MTSVFLSLKGAVTTYIHPFLDQPLFTMPLMMFSVAICQELQGDGLETLHKIISASNTW